MVQVTLSIYLHWKTKTIPLANNISASDSDGGRRQNAGSVGCAEDTAVSSSLCELGEVGKSLCLVPPPLPRPPSCPLRGRSPAAQARPAAPRTATRWQCRSTLVAGRARGLEQN